MSNAAMDLTREWRDLIGNVRHQLAAGTSTSADRRSRAGGWGASKGGDGSGGALFTTWRTPLSPFMQQATELNYSIKDMHTFLLQHFHGYIDLHHSLPSQRSVMSEEDKDLIDLEVTSFMTACAAGVDALKALLQRERLRRMEQESSANEDSTGGGSGMTVEIAADGSGMGAGSRPAHENAAVTFLFERLKAVTEVAETMQTERHKRTAEQKARFYSGPATKSRTASEAAAVAAAATAGPTSAVACGTTPAGDAWRPTPEEMEEERLLEESLIRPPSPSAAAFVFTDPGNTKRYDGTTTHTGKGLSGEVAWAAAVETGADANVATETPIAAAAAAAAAAGSSYSTGSTSMLSSSIPSPPASTKAGGGGGAMSPRRVDSAGHRRRQPTDEDSSAAAAADSVVVERGNETAGAKRKKERRNNSHRGGGGVGGSEGDWGEESAPEPSVPVGALQAENADLVVRYQNELDDARLVETKMSEISGLMGLFASKVVEQQGGMEHVFDAAVSVNDKLVRGGEHLEKAIERGGAFRMFYAWFMMGASLCLLFLHFYRP